MRQKMTVEKLWKLAKTSETKLLSSYSADWWDGYLTDSEAIDRYFARKYKSFEYRGAEVGMEDDELLEQWVQDVEDILLVNSEKFKRIAELKLLNYSITSDYADETVVDRDSTFDKGQGSITNDAFTTPFDSGQLTQTGSATVTDDSRHDASAEDSTTTSEGYHTNPTENARKYSEFWRSYGFYSEVFNIIVKELLMVGGGLCD